MKVVAVLGASSDPNRYSHKAVEMLQDSGYEVVPLNPKEKDILGLQVLQSIPDLVKTGKAVDTLTIYVNPALSSGMETDIISLHPRRVIFNPGAENTPLANNLKKQGIEVEEACTLVLLRTRQF